NEKTTKVIEAAFQHTKYPTIKGEKALLFGSKIVYGLDNLEIHNLTIGQSTFELRPGEGISLNISNVSVVFKGTIQYAYGSWLLNFGHSVNFEVESQIDLGINPKLYCGNGKVSADTSDCYLKFHKLDLLLQGDREPNWLKKVFTHFLTFTIKVAVRGQICQEINKVANILADFIQDTAENFLTAGGISVDIGVTGSPVITNNYIESYHKGFTKYNNTTAVIEESKFNPRHLPEDRMLYFWLSDELFNPLIKAAHEDGRFQLNISGPELTVSVVVILSKYCDYKHVFMSLQELFKTNPPDDMPEFFQKCILESNSAELRVWSTSPGFMNTSRDFGSTVWAEASGQLHCGDSTTPTLSFDTNVITEIRTSYANKKVSLHGKMEGYTKVQAFLENAVKKTGVLKVLTVLETETTRLLNKQGVHLFDIYNPEVIPQD
ncbi:hypothetical protein NL108_003215, partial [Boleophthalmus pectinirostris]